MTLLVLPDVEAACIRYVSGRSEVSALLGANVGSTLAKARPAARLNRWGGVPLHSIPLKFDGASIQCDVFADTKAVARQAVETIRAVLAEWPFRNTDPVIHVFDVVFGPLHWSPDTATTPAEPRYLFDCTITYSN